MYCFGYFAQGGLLRRWSQKTPSIWFKKRHAGDQLAKNVVSAKSPCMPDLSLSISSTGR